MIHGLACPLTSKNDADLTTAGAHDAAQRLSGQGSPCHFDGFTPNPSAPGFSPWDSDAAGSG